MINLGSPQTVPHEVEDQVFAAIKEVGIPVLAQKTLIPGRWVRFSTSDDPRDASGSVKLFDDLRGAVFQDFRSGRKSYWHADINAGHARSSLHQERLDFITGTRLSRGSRSLIRVCVKILPWA